MPSWWDRAADAYGLREAREYGRTAWILTLGTLFLGTGRGIVAPFLVIFLVAERGIPLSIIGLGITFEFLLRALVGPVAGAISDRRGRKPLMLAGLLATSIILPSYLLVTNAAQFFLLSAVNGLFAAHSLYGPASSAMVVDVVPKNRRGGVFGLIHASRNLGWTIGILLGALLVAEGFALVFIGGALLPFAFMFALAALVHEPRNRSVAARGSMFRDWGAVLGQPNFRAYLVLSIPFYLGWGYFNTLFPLFVTSADGLDLPETAMGILSVNTILVFLLQVPFGRLADRHNRYHLMAYSALASAAGYAIYVWAPPLAPLVPVLLVVGAGIVVFTFAEMLFTPILSPLGAELAPAGHTGSALGILGFSLAIGQGVPPLLADWIVPRWGWGVVWLLLAAASVASAIGMLWLAKRVGADEASAAGAGVTIAR